MMRWNRNNIVRRILSSLGTISILVLTNDVQITYGQQIVGTDICACQPSTYQLILNLSASCPETTVNKTIPGILDSACQVESRDQSTNITDPFPVLVSSVIVSELGSDLLPLSQAVYRGQFVSGDILTYTSIVLTENITAANLPRGFQVVLTGINAEEETLTNTCVITYDNDCGIFPLLTKGEQIGWIIFGDLGNPPQDICPVAPPPPPSDQPSTSPSTQFVSSEMPTTASPSVSPGATPNAMPTAMPSLMPSTMPSDMPSDMPSGNNISPTTAAPTSSSHTPTTHGNIPPIYCPPIGGNKPGTTKSPASVLPRKKNKGDNHHIDVKGTNRRLMTGDRPTIAPTSCPEQVVPKEPPKKKTKCEKYFLDVKGSHRRLMTGHRPTLVPISCREEVVPKEPLKKKKKCEKHFVHVKGKNRRLMTGHQPTPAPSICLEDDDEVQSPPKKKNKITSPGDHHNDAGLKKTTKGSTTVKKIIKNKKTNDSDRKDPTKIDEVNDVDDPSLKK